MVTPSPPVPTSWTFEIVLGVAGALCVLTAFGMPQSELPALLGTLLLGLLLWSIVLWRVLQRRQPMALRNDGEPVMSADSPALYRMIPGRVYEVQQAFTDHAGQSFRRGERFTFRQRHFLPYHDGHTLMFEGRVVQLQGEQQREMVEHWDRYMTAVRRPFDPPPWPVVDPALRQRVEELLVSDAWPPRPPATDDHERAARAAERLLLEQAWNLPTDDLYDSMDDGIRLLNETMDREVPWLGRAGRSAIVGSFVANRR